MDIFSAMQQFANAGSGCTDGTYSSAVGSICQNIAGGVGQVCQSAAGTVAQTFGGTGTFGSLLTMLCKLFGLGC